MRLIKSVLFSALFMFVGAQTVLAAVNPAAADSISKNTAEGIAAEYVPSQSELLKTEQENGSYVFRFYNKNSQEWYKVTVGKAKGEIMAFDSCKTLNKGGSQVLMDEEAAQDVVLNEMGDIQIVSCNLIVRDECYQYEINLTGEGFTGKYTVNPETGAVLTREVAFQENLGAEIVLKDEDLETPLASSVYIGNEKAKKAALNKLPGAEVDSCDLEYENGRAIYKGGLKKGCFRYDFEIDAITGTMITWEMRSEG